MLQVFSVVSGCIYLGRDCLCLRRGKLFLDVEISNNSKFLPENSTWVLILDSEWPSLRNADDLSIINIAKQVRQKANTNFKFTTASAEIIDNEAV